MILGIDLGTTKTAAVLYDPATPAESRAESAVHHAALPAAPAGPSRIWRRSSNRCVNS